MTKEHLENMILQHNVSLGRAIADGDFNAMAAIAKDLAACAEEAAKKRLVVTLEVTADEYWSLRSTIHKAAAESLAESLRTGNRKFYDNLSSPLAQMRAQCIFAWS